MPLDARAKRFLDRLASLGPPSAATLTVAERRSALEHLLSFAGAQADRCKIEEHSVPGPAGSIRIRVYEPGDIDSGTSPGLVYFHGGGLVAGSLDTHDGICRQLTLASGFRLVSVDYRLAPEHPFPCAIEDGCAAAEGIFERATELRIDSSRIGVCGDSAGGTLAAVVTQCLVADGRVRPAFQFLLCPIMDFGAESDSRRELAQGYFLDRETLEHDLRYYLPPGVAATDPRVSPLRAPDLSSLPVTCIHTAEFDPLRDEGKAYAERLTCAGVQTRYRCHSGMIHLFYGMGTLIPYASTAFELMGSDIRAALARNF